MTTTDPRAWLAEVQERHQPEAWEADAFEYSTSGIGCTGCECGECGNIGDFDGPCPTSAMAAALTAVLDIRGHGPLKYPHGDDWAIGRTEGFNAALACVQSVIHEALGGDRG